MCETRLVEAVKPQCFDGDNDGGGNGGEEGGLSGNFKRPLH